MSSFLDAHRWRRMGWPRIVMYIVFVLFLLHLLTSFSISSTEQPQQQQEAIVEPASHDFPWYNTQGHAKLDSLQNHKFTTTHLSTEERNQLTHDTVNKAKKLVQGEFNSIQGIPGSIFNGNTRKSNQFRALVDCWTTGKWVQVASRKNLMPHFQDPLYGSCDRRFAKQNKLQGGQRDAVKYVWQSQCDTSVELDGTQWCQVLRGRHLLVVGDLVQYQLHELFLDTLRDGPAVCFGELNCKGKTE